MISEGCLMLYTEELFAPQNVCTVNMAGMFVLGALNAETFDKFHGYNTCISFLQSH